jgi:hypothetical protein
MRTFVSKLNEESEALSRFIQARTVRNKNGARIAIRFVGMYPQNASRERGPLDFEVKLLCFG